MKRIIPVLLIIALFLTPCAAFAQGTLGGALSGLLGGSTTQSAEETVAAILTPMGAHLYGITETACFARIIFTNTTEDGPMVSLQYCTNVNDMVYIIQYIHAGADIGDETLAQLDAAVTSLKFIETEAE